MVNLICLCSFIKSLSVSLSLVFPSNLETLNLAFAIHIFFSFLDVVSFLIHNSQLNCISRGAYWSCKEECLKKWTVELKWVELRIMITSVYSKQPQNIVNIVNTPLIPPLANQPHINRLLPRCFWVFLVRQVHFIIGN